MNRTLPLILTAALLLTACASAVPAQPADATTSPSAAASSPSQPAAETSAPPLTPKFPVGHLLTLPQNQNSGPVWNTGDALYELRDASNMTPEALVLKTDYAALTQSVYCDIPGCTHDSDACPAYLASDFCVGVMAVDGTVYTYPGELTNVAPTQIYRIDPAAGKTPVAAVPDALPHHMQLQWCDEYALYGCPLAASHQPGTLYRWDWQNDTVQTIPMLADEKIIACEGSRFLTIRIEANEPFPNFGSTEQEKAILAHAVYVYAWLDPATARGRKSARAPTRTAISTTITTAGSTTPAISATPTPPASRPPCCTLTLPTAPRKRCSRPSRFTPTASTCAHPSARRLRACRSGISACRMPGTPTRTACWTWRPATSSRPPRSRRRACAAPHCCWPAPRRGNG